MALSSLLSARGIIETADKAFLLALFIIDILVYVKYRKLLKYYSDYGIPGTNKIIDLPDLPDNALKMVGVKARIESDNHFQLFYVIIKIIELLVIIRIMLTISFYCKTICNAIDLDYSLTGHVYNFVLALISSILVIVVSIFSIQYIQLIKSGLLGKLVKIISKKNN